MICLYLKVPENFVHLILQDRFWVVHVLCICMVKSIIVIIIIIIIIINDNFNYKLYLAKLRYRSTVKFQ